MRLHTDNEINNRDRHTLTQMLRKREYLSQEAGEKHAVTQLKEKLKSTKEQDLFICWLGVHQMTINCCIAMND